MLIHIVDAAGLCDENGNGLEASCATRVGGAEERSIPPVGDPLKDISCVNVFLPECHACVALRQSFVFLNRVSQQYLGMLVMIHVCSWVYQEIHMWIFENVRRKWHSVRKRWVVAVHALHSS